MNVNEVIKYPILSEKTYAQMSTGVYTFAVDKRTNKFEIKNAVEFIFDVKVKGVNVINVTKKAKRVGKYSGFIGAYKKAIVTLKDGQINIFPEEVAAKPTKAKIKKEDEPKGISEAEQKAADKIAAKLAEKETKPAVKKETKPAVKKEVKPAVKKETKSEVK